jgi:hypothetical protein
MFQQDAKTLTCPAGKRGAPPIVIAFGKILAAEARQVEIASVTPEKASMLLEVYNTAWRELHALFSKLSYEKVCAEKEANRRKAIVLLEIVPTRLKDLGVASSADTRQAVLDLDEEYQDYTDRVAQLEAVCEYMKGKLKSFENAFTAVKKVMQEDLYGMLYKGQDGTSAGAQGTAKVGQTEGFGRPKY